MQKWICGLNWIHIYYDIIFGDTTYYTEFVSRLCNVGSKYRYGSDILEKIFHTPTRHALARSRCSQPWCGRQPPRWGIPNRALRTDLTHPSGSTEDCNGSVWACLVTARGPSFRWTYVIYHTCLMNDNALHQLLWFSSPTPTLARRVEYPQP